MRELTSHGLRPPRGCSCKPARVLFEEPLAPLADDLAWRVEFGRDLSIFKALGGIEDDLGPDDVSMRCRIPAREGVEALLFFESQTYEKRALPGHEVLSASAPGPHYTSLQLWNAVLSRIGVLIMRPLLTPPRKFGKIRSRKTAVHKKKFIF